MTFGIVSYKNVSDLILIQDSFLRIVMFSSFEGKTECNYCFGGLYLDSFKILLGKSLSFWWSVPPVFHILLGISLRFWWTVPPLFFSLLFFVNLVITDKRENVNNKIRKI